MGLTWKKWAAGETLPGVDLRFVWIDEIHRRLVDPWIVVVFCVLVFSRLFRRSRMSQQHEKLIAMYSIYVYVCICT